jgi:membrane-bound serine protease (ClpP class)
MVRNFLQIVLGSLVIAGLAAAEPAPTALPPAAPAAVVEPAAKAPPAARVSVVVIPVRDEIARPVLYILRRGIKDAIDQKADVIVLDIKTPGGALDVTFDIMEALEKFPGKTVAYVNTEAMSAGAFISATTQEIWFAPNGVIGAAAPVLSGGKDIEADMKLKVVSYLKVRMRAISKGKGYRGEVISAMIDSTKELKIGDKVIKEKGELLSLTDTEAMKEYGDPPQPLLGAGIAKDVEALLTQKFGAGGYVTKTLEITWSERLAVLLNMVTPVLLGLGLVALYIEFKTPGFGFFGIAGIVLLVIVFLGNFVAGLSGHEPLLVFTLGLLLILIEVFFFPGTVVMALTGLLLVLGALLWSMADIWPNQPVELSGDVLVVPVQKLALGFLIAGGLLALVYRFLPHGWIGSRLAVGGAVAGAGVPVAVLEEQESLVGREGVAATGLFPSGQVEIDGRRYEARVEVGAVPVGTPVRVVRRMDFYLVVEAKQP